MDEGKILVVEDDPLNQDLLESRLKKAGYSVRTADNGRAALEMLGSEEFDLVLLDLLMPEMSGYETLERMMASDTLRHIPVIVITALDELDSAVRCIEMGAMDFVPKPPNPVLLRARVNASLAAKRHHDREVALHEELEAKHRHLEELERLRDELTHMVVHDLRSPLSSVLLGLQSVGVQGELNDRQRQSIDAAMWSARRLLGLINDLLDISKMEDGSMVLERTPIRAEKLAGDAVRQVEVLAKMGRRNLSSDVGEGLPAVEADQEKLLRALVNLLDNAIKFTPPGGAVGLLVRLAAGGDGMLFQVSDTGEGIPKEYFGRIFEKFGQVETRASGHRMSTGLGLTFCKMVAEAHGGKIEVASELGQGSIFSMTVPLEAPRLGS